MLQILLFPLYIYYSWFDLAQYSLEYHCPPTKVKRYYWNGHGTTSKRTIIKSLLDKDKRIGEMQGRSRPLFSHLSPICKSPLGNGGREGPKFLAMALRDLMCLITILGWTWFFFTELKGIKEYTADTDFGLQYTIFRFARRLKHGSSHRR